MEITAIIPQKHHPHRVNIFLDGEFAFSLPIDIVIREHLEVGHALNSLQVDELIKVHEFAASYNQAPRFLTFRPRSKQEMILYLSRKNIGNRILEQILAKLETQKLINDYDFARWFVENRLSFRPKGKRLLTMELKEKGVDQEVIDAVLNEYVDVQGELEMVKKLLDKKRSSYSQLPKREQKQKLIAFLVRRGFSWDVISKALPLHEL